MSAPRSAVRRRRVGFCGCEPPISTVNTETFHRQALLALSSLELFTRRHPRMRFELFIKHRCGCSIFREATVTYRCIYKGQKGPEEQFILRVLWYESDFNDFITTACFANSVGLPMPAVEYVALGRRSALRQPFLVRRWVEGKRCDEVLRRFGPEARRQLACELGMIYAMMYYTQANTGNRLVAAADSTIDDFHFFLQGPDPTHHGSAQMVDFEAVPATATGTDILQYMLSVCEFFRRDFDPNVTGGNCIHCEQLRRGHLANFRTMLHEMAQDGLFDNVGFCLQAGKFYPEQLIVRDEQDGSGSDEGYCGEAPIGPIIKAVLGWGHLSIDPAFVDFPTLPDWLWDSGRYDVSVGGGTAWDPAEEQTLKAAFFDAAGPAVERLMTLVPYEFLRFLSDPRSWEGCGPYLDFPHNAVWAGWEEYRWENYGKESRTFTVYGESICISALHELY